MSAPPLTIISPDLAAWAQIASAAVLHALDTDDAPPFPTGTPDATLRVVRRAST